MNQTLVTVLLAVLSSSVISAIVTFMFTRRKIAAEIRELTARSASQDVDTDTKIAKFLEEMRNENIELNKRNVELEKRLTDQERQIELLASRLAARDQQLEAATKDLDLLRKLAKDSGIVETLREQLNVVNQVVVNLNGALDKGQDAIIEKDKIMNELVRTNNNLKLQKPGKTPSQ